MGLGLGHRRYVWRFSGCRWVTKGECREYRDINRWVTVEGEGVYTEYGEWIGFVFRIVYRGCVLQTLHLIGYLFVRFLVSLLPPRRVGGSSVMICPRTDLDLTKVYSSVIISLILTVDFSSTDKIFLCDYCRRRTGSDFVYVLVKLALIDPFNRETFIINDT